MRRPRLVYVVTHPMTARLLLRGQIEWMEERGYEVTVITSSEQEPAYAGSVDQAVRSVPMTREISPLRDLVALFRLTRELRRLQPDVVNASTPKAGLLGCLAARMAGIPARIYTLRGLRLETTTGLRRRILLAAERLACASAHRVLCVSESLRRRALELELCPPEKIAVSADGSSNGVEVGRFAEVPVGAVERLRAELGLHRGPVIGFVGRLTRDKGIGDLRLLFERVRRELPAARMLLVGGQEPGDPVSLSASRWLAEDPGVVDVGSVVDPAPYYALMDVVAFPSRREGMPNVPLEAAAAGVPTVGYAATGTVDAIVDGETGALVELEDVDALTAGVLEYLKSPELAHRHGEAARERVASRFRPEAIWRAVAREYDRLLDPVPAEGRPRTGSFYRQHGKRVFDLIAACLALTLAAPVMAVVAVLVRLRLGPGVLYRQARPGLDGKTFTLLKFRTMTSERDASGELLADERRLTPFGRALRRWSLDELPELLNVVRGDMSLVGPRPLLVEYLDRYDAEQARRHEVPPGITGWAQVNGRNAISWSRRLALDVWYVDRQSFALDLGILLATVRQIFSGEGVSAAGHATMPKFRGASEGER